MAVHENPRNMVLIWFKGWLDLILYITGRYMRATLERSNYTSCPSTQTCAAPLDESEDLFNVTGR